MVGERGEKGGNDMKGRTEKKTIKLLKTKINGLISVQKLGHYLWSSQDSFVID